MVTSVSMGETTGTPPPTTAIRVTSDARQLDAWILALKARGIPAYLQRVDGVVVLHVLPTHLDAAGLQYGTEQSIGQGRMVEGVRIEGHR